MNLTNKAEDAQAELVKLWFTSGSGMRASEIWCVRDMKTLLSIWALVGKKAKQSEREINAVKEKWSCFLSFLKKKKASQLQCV